jgi:hypothetical protein
MRLQASQLGLRVAEASVLVHGLRAAEWKNSYLGVQLTEGFA